MPFRDAASTLGSVLDDIAAQTLEDWELLAVDDRSADDGPARVRERAGRDPRVRLLEPGKASGDHGIVPALNLGCAAANAPLIARMDADDRMAPERLARQVALLEGDRALGVAGCLVEFGGDPEAARGFAEYVSWSNRQRSPREILLRRFIEMPLVHPSMVFRRELLGHHGAYREGPFPEDYELVLRWLEAGVAMAKVPEVLIRWNDPPGRLTRRDTRYAVERHYEMKCRYLASELERIANGRPIWLWGAGRVTRRRFDGLEEHGVTIAGLVDIDPRKLGRRIGGVEVVEPSAIPKRHRAFVLVGVAARGARESIAEALERQGRNEGEDFLLAG